MAFVIFAIFLGGAVTCALLSIVTAVATAWGNRRLKPADGVVVSMASKDCPMDGADGPVCSPRVEFTDGHGIRTTFVNEVWSYPSRYRVGQAVKVLYSPADPAKAKVDGFWNNYGVTVMLGVLALIMALAACAVRFDSPGGCDPAS
jgi:hypothetical protein